VFEDTVPSPRQLIDGFSLQDTGFDPRSVRVRFVVCNVTLEQVLLRRVRFSPVSIITVIFVGDCLLGGGGFDNCVGVSVICVFVFTVFCIVSFMYIYSYLFCLY